MHTSLRTFLLALGLSVGTIAAAQQPLDKIFDLFRGQGSGSLHRLSDTRIAAGLKEALRVGMGHAVARTEKVDGYWGNPRIKIPLPETWRTVEKGLRLAGYSTQVDALILSLNRAAEHAAPQAKRIFVAAIAGMSFDDARRILQGGETAATVFFQDHTRTALYDAFRPVVDHRLNQVGSVQKYNALTAYARRIPFLKSASLDLGDYVTHKALDGLFLIVAEEEKRIRHNPAARITDLLKEVFSQG